MVRVWQLHRVRHAAARSAATTRPDRNDVTLPLALNVAMRRLLLWLDSRGLAAINSLALLLLLLISGLDYATPPEITTSVFYFAPIAIAAWFGGRGSGVVMAAAVAVAWLVKDVAFRGLPYADIWILSWNTAARLLMFTIVSLLITEVRVRLRREERLARTDTLTGLFNVRAFHEELGLELARAARSGQPLSFAYADLDNFKPVNDERGHAEGDKALVAVADVLRYELRRSDIIGRLGGDEFAIILPATGSPEARAVVGKLQRRIQETMQRHGWPITASIGLITCPAPPAVPEVLVRAADRLMYQVKISGKNALVHDVWPSGGVPANREP